MAKIWPFSFSPCSVCFVDWLWNNFSSRNLNSYEIISSFLVVRNIIGVVPFVFAFVAYGFGVMSMKSLPRTLAWSFLPCFHLDTVSGVRFKSLINFELIFVYNVSSGSNFIFMHGNIHFYRHQLFMRPSFSHCVLGILVKDQLTV